MIDIICFPVTIPGGVSRNFTYASTTPEDANTRIRAKWVLDTPAGTFKFSLETDNIYHKGLVKITSVAGADVVIGTAALSSNTVTIDTSSAHGLSTNDYVLISGLEFSTTDPNGIHQITVSDADKKEIADTRNTNGEDANSNSLDVSFSNWSFTTDGTWNGSLVIQRSIAGGTYENYVVIADTTGGVSRNFKSY